MPASARNGSRPGRRRSSRAVASAGAASVAFCLGLVASGAAAQPRAFAVDDLALTVRIEAPQIAPDGRHAVAIVSRVDTAHNRLNEELDLIDIARGTHRALTFERSGLGAPQWSPDGGRIAFIAATGPGENAKGQIFVLPMDGGDARRVTAAPEGVEQYIWRPDGGALAYAAVDPAPKRTGRAAFADGYDVGNGSNLLPGGARPARVWLALLAGGAPQLLTPDSGSVTSGEALSTLSFSPDGRSLAYLWAPTPILNDADFATARAVDCASRVTRPISGHTNRERDPLFSPDGKHVAYIYSAGDNQTNPQDAYVTAAAGGTPSTNVSQPVDAYVHDTAWQGDSSALWFRSTAGTHTAVWRAPIGQTPHRLELGELEAESPLNGAIAADGTFVFVASSTQAPPELYVATLDGSTRALTDYNRTLAARAFGRSERITFPTSTGIAGDAVLLKPPGYSAGRRYPLVLVIHGGPTDASTQSFDDFGQLLAARGWLVLEPNYRGSNNLGHAYLNRIYNDASAGPGRDVMAAVDAVRALGIVDPQRIAVSGWSYGGVMTTWMITHYHIWAAAVSGAAVTDWIADYSIADDIDTDLYLFHGSPFVRQHRAQWLRQESISYVDAVTTPVLLMADRGDARVPNVSSYEFYHALRDLGKPVQFIVYPVDGHFPRDPARTADIYARWIGYIGEHFAK